MKDIRMLLPNLASDTAGAASALFSLGGLTVIHDAAGSLEVFVTFDEHRDLEGRRTVASRLSQLEAVTGDDSILLGKLEAACEQERPPFIALIGSPVPFTIGTDLEGIAAEAEFSTGVPAIAVPAGGFHPYDKGVAEALEKILARFARPAMTQKNTVNLLGATPLDYSEAEIGGICQSLQHNGVETVRSLTMTEGLEEIRAAADARYNLVISASGLPAARYMKKKFGIPYEIGAALPRLSPEIAPSEDRRVLVLGEAVLAKELTSRLLAGGVPAVAGVTGSDDREIYPEIPKVSLLTENSLREELKKDWFAVVGDPLYRLLLPENSKVKWVQRPHRALSSRLYTPNEHTLDQLIHEIERCLL